MSTRNFQGLRSSESSPSYLRMLFFLLNAIAISRDLISQLRRIVASYPPHIQYRENMEWPRTTNSTLHVRAVCDIYIITRIQLDVLQCRFLLQRLLVSRHLGNGQELFDIAQEMMSLVLSLWLHRDQLQYFSHAFDWLVRHFSLDIAPTDCTTGRFIWNSLCRNIVR